MNTQQEMMRILHATNAYYQSPTKNGWETALATDSIYATHKDTGRIFIFTLDPESKVIKAESYSFKKPGSITIYTGTITLGGRLIAPDMILTLHTLFNFDFASDAIFVVENNRAKLMPENKTKQNFDAASDAIKRANNSSVFSVNKSLNRHSSNLLSVSNSHKISKVLRYFIYGESPFRRKS
jgi:hypothetical protein